MSDETTVFFPRKLVKQFIRKYQELECLWNRDCAAYKIKKRRHQAITQLTQLVQTFDPAATRVHVLRKIDSLRACVRREYKKVTDSRQTATSDDEVYVPQLWYYSMFSFLIRQDEQDTASKAKEVDKTEILSPVPVVESSEEDEVEEKVFETAYESNFDFNVPTTSPKEPQRKRIRVRALESLTGIDDEYDAIGMNVAAKLRYLPANMRILAEKLIGDVLFQAQTNGLTAASALVTPDPFR